METWKQETATVRRDCQKSGFLVDQHYKRSAGAAAAAASVLLG